MKKHILLILISCILALVALGNSVGGASAASSTHTKTQGVGRHHTATTISPSHTIIPQVSLTNCDYRSDHIAACETLADPCLFAHQYPNLSSKQVGCIPYQKVVYVYCQAAGDTYNGPDGSTNVWDFVGDKDDLGSNLGYGYVSDYYMSTAGYGVNGFDPQIPRCANI